MRWEELSMSDRSNLMKTYLQNGVIRLSDMRDHYNKFNPGGNLGGAHGEVPFTSIYAPTIPAYTNSNSQYGFLKYIGVAQNNRSANKETWEKFHDRIFYNLVKHQSPEQIGALLSNSAIESHFKEDAKQPNGDHAVGEFQMHSDALEEYTRKYGDNLNYKNQYDHIDSLINHSNAGLPGGKRYKIRNKTDTLYKYLTGEEMRDIWHNPETTAGDKSEAFIGFYEKSGKPLVQQRRLAADSISSYIRNNFSDFVK